MASVGAGIASSAARPGDIQGVISSLEEEFAVLNGQVRLHFGSLTRTPSLTASFSFSLSYSPHPSGRRACQYRRLLASVQTQSPGVDASQAEELVAIIQKLHKKGEQLRALKMPTR
jgi:hypothetical protein